MQKNRSITYVRHLSSDMQVRKAKFRKGSFEVKVVSLSIKNVKKMRVPLNGELTAQSLTKFSKGHLSREKGKFEMIEVAYLPIKESPKSHQP